MTKENIHKLVEKIREDSKGIICDYKNNNVDYEFVNGVVIGYDCILNYIEEIWDIDVSVYRTNLNF